MTINKAAHCARIIIWGFQKIGSRISSELQSNFKKLGFSKNWLRTAQLRIGPISEIICQIHEIFTQTHIPSRRLKSFGTQRSKKNP